MSNPTSTLTDRYQTTIPKAVRQALRLNKGDKIGFEILTDGRVRLIPIRANGRPEVPPQPPVKPCGQRREYDIFDVSV